MKVEIKNRFTDKVILCGEYESIKDCLEKNQGANLQEANLRGANLQEANLWRADLQGANLRGADLWRANLRGANLRRANLQEANLQGADLWRANLQEADLQGANLWRADLQGANLQGANLQEADLWRANLQEANLQGADLWRANLQGADLQGANLWRANLRGGKNFEPYNLCDLYSLKLLPQETILRFWKYLNKGESPYQNFKYEVGKEYNFDDCEKSEYVLCGKGGNVATLTWCLRDNLNADEFIEVEFQVKDIVAIPINSDGKFRVSYFKVLRKINRKQAIRLLNKLIIK